MVSSKVCNPPRTSKSAIWKWKNRIIQGLLRCRIISSAGRNLNDINVGAYTRFLAALDMTLYYDFLQVHLICMIKITKSTCRLHSWKNGIFRLRHADRNLIKIRGHKMLKLTASMLIWEGENLWEAHPSLRIYKVDK